MKNNYKEPEMELVSIGTEDVICSSACGAGTGNSIMDVLDG